MSSSKNASSHLGEDRPQDMVDSIKDLGAAAAGVGSETKEQVSNLTDQVRQRATEQLTSQKEQFVDGLETVALLLHQAAEHAQQQEKTLIANYVDQAAQQVSSFTDSIDQQDLTQVLQTTKDFARREPMLFVGSALVAGFLGARFMRSSTAQSTQGTQESSTDNAIAAIPTTATATATATATDDVIDGDSDVLDEFEAGSLQDDTYGSSADTDSMNHAEDHEGSENI